MFRWLMRQFGGVAPDPVLVDHVQVSSETDWRTEKLKEAARRHGKSFKCAADGLPREITKGGTVVAIGLPTRQQYRQTNVAAIGRKAK